MRLRAAEREVKMSKFVCPFCLREYNKSEVLYWCSKCGKPVKKPAFGKIKCSCGGIASARKCKYSSCDAGSDGTDFIPKDALEMPYLSFSIVGLSNSGKTNFITVMLNELQHSSGLHLPAGPLNKDSKKKQSDNYELIYLKHDKPDATKPGSEKPQIWNVRNVAKRKGNTVPTYTFTIFDGAGESHQELDSSSTECRYIAASKAIIVTIDPLALEGVKNGGFVDSKTINNSRPSQGNIGSDSLQSVDIVNGVADYIKTAIGIKGTKRLTMPVALVLTKFDTVLGHPAFGENALVKHPSNVFVNGEYRETEAIQIDNEIKGWLTEIGEEAFIDAVEANFSNYCFFGVSSYGSVPPSSQKTPDSIDPHRVLDPILWLFHQVKFI